MLFIHISKKEAKVNEYRKPERRYEVRSEEIAVNVLNTQFLVLCGQSTDFVPFNET